MAQGYNNMDNRRGSVRTGSGQTRNYRTNRVSIDRQKQQDAQNQAEAKKRAEAAKKEALMEAYVQEELRKREKRRKIILRVCGLVALCCLGYFGIYSYYNQRTQNTYEQLSALKDKSNTASQSQPVQQGTVESGPLYTLDDAPQTKEVLDEYKDLLNVNKKLIGWLRIDDINTGEPIIDYPVMQTSDNEYYLNHNLNQEYDNNGSIFMDKDCDAMTPSTNLILYGHHMKSGKMFGKLHLYEKKSYYEDHPYIQFDTIYEKGLYQVMYVFRSRVYNEDEIVFKYYQFIDANSEQEFDSYMKEMDDMSFYDTGVTAGYGDDLLTLSTCDYEEKNGRFVVVAKKIAKE